MDEIPKPSDAKERSLSYRPGKTTMSELLLVPPPSSCWGAFPLIFLTNFNEFFTDAYAKVQGQNYKLFSVRSHTPIYKSCSFLSSESPQLQNQTSKACSKSATPNSDNGQHFGKNKNMVSIAIGEPVVDYWFDQFVDDELHGHIPQIYSRFQYQYPFNQVVG
ncbi:hypothetical protein DFJ58DRAFT_848609 [Suillus subalutaceus]|uniref:uncharacterized protein n=1 Tax=Suillus subalutaceus TaxID=48586 RepID=UPI001B87873B|nr:uncharacterized protein DFJ58DRAFT_848609 [Suillus subalutaceus]KAG1829725.1 hypothetical protein DFJ58DRAFT_848609 [Suillus subalutaceus]